MGDDLAAVFAFVLMAGFAAYAKRYAVAGAFVLVADSVAGHGALLTHIYWRRISTRFAMPCIPKAVQLIEF